jgi:hypothetical protein
MASRFPILGFRIFSSLCQSRSISLSAKADRSLGRSRHTNQKQCMPAVPLPPRCRTNSILSDLRRTHFLSQHLLTFGVSLFPSAKADVDNQRHVPFEKQLKAVAAVQLDAQCPTAFICVVSGGRLVASARAYGLWIVLFLVPFSHSHRLFSSSLLA